MDVGRLLVSFATGFVAEQYKKGPGDLVGHKKGLSRIRLPFDMYVAYFHVCLYYMPTSLLITW